jgi:hypothetical protein
MITLRIKENFRHDDVGEIGYGFYIPRDSRLSKEGYVWHEVVTVCKVRRSFGAPGFKVEVNWSALGSQGFTNARTFAEALLIATPVAEFLSQGHSVELYVAAYGFKPEEMIG